MAATSTIFKLLMNTTCDNYTIVTISNVTSTIFKVCMNAMCDNEAKTNFCYICTKFPTNVKCIKPKVTFEYVSNYESIETKGDILWKRQIQDNLFERVWGIPIKK